MNQKAPYHHQKTQKKKQILDQKLVPTVKIQNLSRISSKKFNIYRLSILLHPIDATDTITVNMIISSLYSNIQQL